MLWKFKGLHNLYPKRQIILVSKILKLITWNCGYLKQRRIIGSLLFIDVFIYKVFATSQYFSWLPFIRAKREISVGQACFFCEYKDKDNNDGLKKNNSSTFYLKTWFKAVQNSISFRPHVVFETSI